MSSCDYDNQTDEFAPSSEARGGTETFQENSSAVSSTPVSTTCNVEQALRVKQSPSITLLHNTQHGNRVIASELQSISSITTQARIEGDFSSVLAENKRLHKTIEKAMQREALVMAVAQRRERELLMEINRLRAKLWIEQYAPSWQQTYQGSILESFSGLSNNSNTLPTLSKVKTEPKSHIRNTVQGKVYKENKGLRPDNKVQPKKRSVVLPQKRRRDPSDNCGKIDKKPKQVGNGDKKPAMFRCALCPEVFEVKWRLTRHIWKHTDNKPYILASRYLPVS